MKKRILISGATGLIGSSLTRRLCESGAYVKILTRDSKAARKSFAGHFALEALEYSKHSTPESLSRIISETDVVINLAGANIGGSRWSSQYKKILYDSRIDLTALLVSAMKLSGSKPECFISASGVGIYGDKGDETVTEESSQGDDFLARLCKDWEREAMKAIELDIRVVTVRTGIVLDKNGGAFPRLILPFKFFAGAYMGSGKQWISWIHIEDIVSLYLFSIENESISGPVNGTAPEPVRNRELIERAGKIIGRNIVLPAPAFALKLALGEFAESLLTGQKVIPAKLTDAGFEFRYPSLDKALKELLKKGP